MKQRIQKNNVSYLVTAIFRKGHQIEVTIFSQFIESFNKGNLSNYFSVEMIVLKKFK